MFMVAIRERIISKTICLEPAAGKTDFRNAARKKKKYLEKYFAKSVTLLKKSCILNMRAKKTTGYGESA